MYRDQVMVPCRVAADPELLTFRWSFNSSDNEVSAWGGIHCYSTDFGFTLCFVFVSLFTIPINTRSEDSSHKVIMSLIKSNVC